MRKEGYKQRIADLRKQLKDREDELVDTNDLLTRLRYEVEKGYEAVNLFAKTEEELKHKITLLESQDSLREHRFSELSKAYAHAHGQLYILKRISGYFPEEAPTREEYKEMGKDILVTTEDLPF